MKSDYENECIYYDVPTYVTKFWADENGRVKFFSSDMDDELDEADYTALFEEYCEIYDGPKDTDTFDAFCRNEVKNAVTAVAAGDESALSQANTALYHYISSLFNVNYWSIGRYRLALGENADLLRDYYRKGKLAHAITLLLASVRHTDEVLMEMTRANEDMLLILDLKPVLIEAPGNSSFVLSSSPLIFFNFLNPEHLTAPIGQEDYYGTVFITPVSPHYALCLYDSYVYKIRKEGKKVVFSDDDMTVVNTLLCQRAHTVVYTETKEFPSSVLLEMRQDEEIKRDEVELSVFLIRNRGLEKMDDVRSYVREVLDYDDTENYFENYGQLSEKDLENRLSHAYEVLAGN